MILFINTAIYPAEIALFQGEKLIKRVKLGKSPKISEFLMTKIVKTLGNMGKTLKDLDKIAVVVGQGAFSRIRTGVVTANTLGFALNIAISGVKTDQIAISDSIPTLLIKIKYSKFQLLPVYGREANITKSKKR